MQTKFFVCSSIPPLDCIQNVVPFEGTKISLFIARTKIIKGRNLIGEYLFFPCLICLNGPCDQNICPNNDENHIHPTAHYSVKIRLNWPKKMICNLELECPFLFNYFFFCLCQMQKSEKRENKIIKMLIAVSSICSSAVFPSMSLIQIIYSIY